MDLFHVSTKKYTVGQIIKAQSFKNTEYYQNAISRGQNWIDDFLDNSRPENAPERKNTIFAFDCVENCIAFKGNSADNFYYKVKMLDPIAYPMCLTDELKKNQNEHNIKITNEYWKPSKDWKFLEYLSPEMEILEIIEAPNYLQLSKGKMNYDNDRNLRKSL